MLSRASWRDEREAPGALGARARSSFLALALAAGVLVLLPACGAGGAALGSNPAAEASSGVFLIPADAPVVRDREWHSATLLDGGDTLIAGGRSATVGGVVAVAELYRAGSQTFSATGSLATPRARHSATRLDTDVVLLAGGEDQNGAALASAELYEPGSGTFGPAAGPLGAARSGHTATLQRDGTVLVVGGDAGGAPLATIERYVPAGGAAGFYPSGSLLTARTRHSALRTVQGETWVAGGFTDAARSVPTASVELLDLATGAPRAARNGLSKPRGGAAAVTLADGRILVAGGAGVGGTALDTAEIYDPIGERTSGAAIMSRARRNPRAVRLFDGRVLVTGDDNTADLFDPGTSTFAQPSSALAQPRAGHTATALFTGDVLIFGGGPPNAPAELFDPR